MNIKPVKNYKKPNYAKGLAVTLATVTTLSGCEDPFAVDGTAPVPDTRTSEVIIDTGIAVPEDLVIPEGTIVTEAEETDIASSISLEDFLFFELPNDIFKLEDLNQTYDGELCIYLQNNCDLSLLANLSELKKLSIDENSNPPGYSPLNSSLIVDFSFLHSMNNISELTITQEPQFPLSSLIGMDNLTKISLYGVKISDYDSVVNTVEELTLDSCDFSLEEIVAVFPNLKKLTILGYWDSLSFIGNLQNLETLTLHQTSYQDIEKITNNKKLENLTLLTRNGIDASILDSPNFILELKNLKTLEIYEGTLSQDFLSMFLDNCPNCDLQIFKTS
ncbi:MAG: hypothetical protein J6B08_01595 [Ruminiclostridium sp.]|nr:hypothetical protein [Ruminiclostridium sp.]